MTIMPRTIRPNVGLLSDDREWSQYQALEDYRELLASEIAGEGVDVIQILSDADECLPTEEI